MRCYLSPIRCIIGDEEEQDVFIEKSKKQLVKMLTFLVVRAYMKGRKATCDCETLGMIYVSIFVIPLCIIADLILIFGGIIGNILTILIYPFILALFCNCCLTCSKRHEEVIYWATLTVVIVIYLIIALLILVGIGG